MDKKILLKEMLQSKDPKRKKMLFEVFENEIHFSASSQFVANYISKELEIENLVSARDVEYCRYNFNEYCGQTEPPWAEQSEPLCGLIN